MRKTLSPLLAALLLPAFSIMLFAQKAKTVEIHGERAVGGIDKDQYQTIQKELFQWLSSEQLPISAESMIKIDVNDREALDHHDSDGKPAKTPKKIKVGVHRPVGVGVDFTDMNPGNLPLKARPQANGVMRATDDGGFVWTIGVEAVGATAVRIHFTDVNLPDSASLYVYNLEGEAFGPYTGKGIYDDGDFWSNTVTGAIAFVQLRQVGPADRETLHDISFVIEDVAHIGSKFLLPFYQNPDKFQHKAFCSFNEPCVEDGSCHSNSATNNARDAVAHIQFASGGFIFICSGGLLADTDSSSQIPYFLTANHCISKGREARSMEAYFQFMTSNCGGACFNPVGAVPRTVGASIRKTSRTSDYTLMELDETPPSGSFFLGWNSTAVANSNGTNLFRLSHPAGAPQAYSTHDVDTSAGTCNSWPRGNWIYSRDVVGATEGGSSGSPVLNASGQVVGQLTGACGFNVNDPCDSASNATVDGAFAAYFDDVAQFLDPDPGPGGGDFPLSAVGYKVQGFHNVDLTWSGASGTNVDIYRDGNLITTTANDGAHTDNTGQKGKGTYVYQVCEAGSSTCSNTVTVSF